MQRQMKQLCPYARLSKQINAFVRSNQQSKDVALKKVHLQQSLLPVIRDVYPKATLHFTGSTWNGSGINTSDIDLCVMANDKAKQQTKKRFDGVKELLTLKKAIKHVVGHKIDVISARVPILKFSHNGVQCDICMNNENALRNTHLLRTYSLYEHRLPPLVMVVKEWARSRGINDAGKGTLSSYALTLMCIHYLQCVPKILPSLQKDHPEHFNISDVGELVRTKPWQLLKSSSSAKVTVGKLLVNFFHYYSHFPWEEKEVCVYRGNSGETPTSNMERKGKKNILDKPSDKTLMRVLD